MNERIRELAEECRPDIYVTDIGQAWGAETNPEMALDPSVGAYYSEERVQYEA